MRLGIMGGTFDPIHNGHLFVAEEARTHFRLNNVLFVPNGSPPHKREDGMTAATHRYAMAVIATHSNPAFSCSPVELNRTGHSYTVDTLDMIQNQNPGAELFTIVGVDAIADILTWKRHEDVMRKTTFIAATRPGFDLNDLKERLPQTYQERILMIGSTVLEISSTDLRSRVRQGHSIRYLTPDGVVEYITKCRLYSNPA